MSQQHDSTHATAIAHLMRANEAARSLADRYNPASPLIQPGPLDAFCTDCEAQLTASFNAERVYNEARDNRKSLFENLATTGTQLVSTLQLSKATAGTVDEARNLVKKIRGLRLGKESTAATPTPGEQIAREISTAQTTYDSRLDHFRKLVTMARNLGSNYTASTDAMQLRALETQLTKMEDANSAVAAAATAFTSALIARDRLLYHEQTGLVARMNGIRTWFIATFGARSAERKLLNGLRVQNLANRRLEAV
jgi:hypothetical protein